MTRPERYNFILAVNQFADPVDKYFEDTSEVLLIDAFEECCLRLKALNRTSYSMIELGSNWAFYSMLFKAILKSSETKNIMIEPYDKYYESGVKHFEMNGFNGEFSKEVIGLGTPPSWTGVKNPNVFAEKKVVTIDELLARYEIDRLDVLHMDIDGNETIALRGARNALANHTIKNLFVLVHDDVNLKNTREILSTEHYNLTLDHPHHDVGGDMLICASCDELLVE